MTVLSFMMVLRLSWMTPFGHRIQAGGGLVHDENRSVLGNDPRDGDALTLTAGKLDPALADQRLIAGGNFLYELVRMGQGRGFPDVGLLGLQVAVADVLA